MEKSKIFGKSEILLCSCCRKNLFENINLAMIIIATDNDNNIICVKPCCKGKCDKTVIDSLPNLRSNFYKLLKCIPQRSHIIY